MCTKKRLQLNRAAAKGHFARSQRRFSIIEVNFLSNLVAHSGVLAQRSGRTDGSKCREGTIHDRLGDHEDLAVGRATGDQIAEDGRLGPERTLELVAIGQADAGAP